MCSFFQLSWSVHLLSLVIAFAHWNVKASSNCTFSPNGLSFHVTSYFVVGFLFFFLNLDTFSKISTLLFTFWAGYTINYCRTTPEFSAEVFMSWAENSACLFLEAWRSRWAQQGVREAWCWEMEILHRLFYHQVASGSSACFKSKCLIKHEQNWFCTVAVSLLVVVSNVSDVLPETAERGVYSSLWHSTYHLQRCS